MKFNENETKLAQFFIEREGEGILEVIKDIDFFDEGIIDSLDFVSLAVYVEDNFGIKLDLTNQDVFQAMKRFQTLIELIQGTTT
jgi:acyl carrier protein|tara:strand:- start:374 stop:625 length:252 start_codon:yes stop_codon:yes gene_type:complete